MAEGRVNPEKAEFQIRNRLSFMRFLGLAPGDPVPDDKTTWLFREHLTRAGAVGTLFARFDRLLREKGHLAMSGQIVDASLIPAPRQHLDDGEKQAIKDGKSARLSGTYGPPPCKWFSFWLISLR